MSLPLSANELLRQALADLAPAQYEAAATGKVSSLHEKVCAVVDEMRAEGMKPEHVVLAVKGIAFEARMGPGSWKLIETMVKWCLEQYFKNS
jgi:hypothetical protein